VNGEIALLEKRLLCLVDAEDAVRRRECFDRKEIVVCCLVDAEDAGRRREKGGIS
jgi:hypothetical protein